MRLIVDSTKKNKNNDEKTFQKKVVTCRSHCALFDELTQQCGVFKNIDVDHPSTPKRCQLFSEIDQEKLDLFGEELTLEGLKGHKFEIIEEDFTVEADGAFTFEMMGRAQQPDENYPFEPNEKRTRLPVIWYTSPDERFGCWVLNVSRKGLMAVQKREEVKQGWSPNIYRSPDPLHYHTGSP